MNPALLGFFRGLGVIILMAILSYIGDTTHIAFIGNPYLEMIIASSALSIEHSFEQKTGKALFGAVRKQ